MTFPRLGGLSVLWDMDRYFCSFDCHEHVLLQGIWASEHLKRGKKVGAISYDIGHFLQNAMINKKKLIIFVVKEIISTI